MGLNYDSIEPFKRRSAEVASKASINRHAPKDERSKDEGRGRSWRQMAFTKNARDFHEPWYNRATGRGQAANTKQLRLHA